MDYEVYQKRPELRGHGSPGALVDADSCRFRNRVLTAAQGHERASNDLKGYQNEQRPPEERWRALNEMCSMGRARGLGSEVERYVVQRVSEAEGFYVADCRSVPERRRPRQEHVMRSVEVSRWRPRSPLGGGLAVARRAGCFWILPDPATLRRLIQGTRTSRAPEGSTLFRGSGNVLAAK